jgi:hypothetical protein
VGDLFHRRKIERDNTPKKRTVKKKGVERDKNEEVW